MFFRRIFVWRASSTSVWRVTNLRVEGVETIIEIEIFLASAATSRGATGQGVAKSTRPDDFTRLPVFLGGVISSAGRFVLPVLSALSSGETYARVTVTLLLLVFGLLAVALLPVTVTTWWCYFVVCADQPCRVSPICLTTLGTRP